jgi:hypothetical protein
MDTCTLQHDLFVTLDTVSSKLRNKHGEVTANDVMILDDVPLNFH